jgi:hypothetical protein
VPGWGAGKSGSFAGVAAGFLLLFLCFPESLCEFMIFACCSDGRLDVSFSYTPFLQSSSASRKSSM